MNWFSKLAFAFVTVAGAGVWQTAWAQSPSSPSASKPAASGTSPAATPPAASQAPDLTFKPGPQEDPGAPPPKAPETAPASSGNSPGAGGAAVNSTSSKPTTADAPLYVLGANDVVSVTVFDEKSVPGTYPIGPDGRISMPLIHDFTAAGLTIPQLEATITEKLGAFVIDPVVNVQLLRNNSKKYTIVGGVQKQGPVQLLQETTILDAIAASGGFREFADQKHITLRRGTKEFHFNYKDVIRGKHLDQNIMIQDGDIIVVKE